MSEIFKQYGGGILVSVAFTLIMAMLFVAWPEGDGSFIDAVGVHAEEHMDAHVMDWDTKNDGAAFDVYAARSKPQVHVERHVKEQETATLDSFLKITNSDGEVWNSSSRSFTGTAGQGFVEIHSILDSEGREIKDVISNGPYYQNYKFNTPDNIIIHMTITDEEGVRVTYKVPVAVDRLPIE